MIITKAHKLYFRTPKRELRRVDKVALKVYSTILNGFINGDHKSRYQYLNREVTTWSKYKPLPIVISNDFKEDFNKLFKVAQTIKESIVISYNGYWQHLVIISLEQLNEEECLKTKK